MIGGQKFDLLKCRLSLMQQFSIARAKGSEAAQYRGDAHTGSVVTPSLTEIRIKRVVRPFVVAVRTDLFQRHGPSDHIRSDTGAKFTAHAIRDWLGRICVKTLYLEPGSPWEKGYNEGFNGKLRDELLNGEIFYTLREATIIIERWRQHYNSRRPHGSLGYQPPAPQTILPRPARLICAALRSTANRK